MCLRAVDGAATLDEAKFQTGPRVGRGEAGGVDGGPGARGGQTRATCNALALRGALFSAREQAGSPSQRGSGQRRTPRLKSSRRASRSAPRASTAAEGQRACTGPAPQLLHADG